jgi:DNA helicase-2/ATP-dependent DNA helicase PcrA
MTYAIKSANVNINQRRAIEWTNGPLLVLAGLGSGKTLVLTLRIAKLLNKSAGERFRILGLTFTTKAASEMKNRVDELVPNAGSRILLSTFHSFAADVLRQHGSHIRLRPDFTILNQAADREEVMKDAIRQLEGQDADFQPSDVKLLPLLDNLMEKLVPEDEVTAHIRDKILGRKLAALYKEYRRQLISNNRLDFPLLLTLTHELLRSKPSIAGQLRNIYTHVCVDEFQDTNLAQSRLLAAILGDSPKDLFVVADDDQIIYQWNGASPERLQELREEYKMHVIQLPVNYRCPPSVITIANNLISHNTGRSLDKEPLSAIKESEVKDVLRVRNFDTLNAELSWIAKDIASRPISARGTCVILARTRKLVEKAAQTLNSAGVEAALSIRKNEFESTPLRWLHAILRLANARGDRDQLRRVCKAFYELEGLDIRVEDVVAASSAEGGDFLRSWVNEALAAKNLQKHTKDFLTSANNQIVERMDFFGLIESSFDWFRKTEKRLSSEPSNVFADFPEEKEIWVQLQESVLQRFGKEDVTLQVLLQEFDLSPKTAPIPNNAVRCFTIHTAKGMEFDHVYLIGLVEDQLPSFQSIKKGDDSMEIQEERRNCFVAITRTQVSLTLTWADEYFGWRKPPSRFLLEMGLNLLAPASRN